MSSQLFVSLLNYDHAGVEGILHLLKLVLGRLQTLSQRSQHVVLLYALETGIETLNRVANVPDVPLLLQQ